MKILMLTPYLPYPPASGGQIRTLYLLKYLSKNHSITLVSLYKDEKERPYAKHLLSYCDEIHLCKRAKNPWKIENIFKSVFSDQPFLIVRNYSEEARSKIDELLSTKKFDVIHAETFYIMPHIPKTDTPILLVEQTIEYKVYQHFISSLNPILRAFMHIDIVKLIRWEKFYWQKADLVATVSESDKLEIQQIVPSIEPAVIPNGAGDEMYVDKFPIKNQASPKLLFLGNFFWLQNVEAAHYLIEKIYPVLKKRVPNIELIVAGQNAGGKLTHHDKDIKIVDIDPGDGKTVMKLYHSATLFIAPIFGPGGTRLKILASMASGLPVVATHIGVEGLGVIEGKHALTAQTPDQFVDQIIKILADDSLYKSIQKEAFILVKEKFSWKSISKKIEGVYKDCIKI